MYYNPVRIIKTNNWIEQCLKFQKTLGILNPIIVTSRGNLERLKLSNIFNSNSIFSNVEPNPTFDDCKLAIEFSQTSKFDCVIAIGGGSVLDTAKVIMASLGTGVSRINELLDLGNLYPHRVPAIFIPTTHGTGSEVTMWGTVWNTEEKKKYSISHSDLYPDVAILDATTTQSLPTDIAITTTLDALSHSFEAIWNKNANVQSTTYAIEAICLILGNVRELNAKYQNINTKRILLNASNMAGFAISNTKTAAAHAISYPLTIFYGIPHGIACSLPLLPLLKINKNYITKELKLIMENLNMNSLSELENCIAEIPKKFLKYTLSEWSVNRTDLDQLAKQSFTKGRMDNNIVDLSSNQVYSILEDIY